MTKQEIMNKYNIKSKDVPVFHGYNWNRICHDEVYNLNWNDVFRKALNKKCGGNTKDILVSAFSASMSSVHIGCIFILFVCLYICFYVCMYICCIYKYIYRWSFIRYEMDETTVGKTICICIYGFN